MDSVADPDVILLHLGTNDANDLGHLSGAIGRLDALISKIAAKRPYAHVIVTSLLPRTETAIDAAITTQFNPSVPDIVAAQAALGRHAARDDTDPAWTARRPHGQGRRGRRLYVEARGATAYQWRRNGVAIGGANLAWLEIAPAALTDSGTCDALVYGSGTASTTSRAALLRVVARGTLMKLR